MSRLYQYLGFSAAFGLALAFGIGVAQAQCQEIRFAKGTSSGIVEGQIPPEAVLCFSIEVAEGQRVEASIRGPEAQFPILVVPGLTGDGGEQDVSWFTRAGTYELQVMTLFRYGANTPFQLRVSITGG